MSNKNTPIPQISVEITNPKADIVTTLERAITGDTAPPIAPTIKLSIVITAEQRSVENGR